MRLGVPVNALFVLRKQTSPLIQRRATPCKYRRSIRFKCSRSRPRRVFDGFVIMFGLRLYVDLDLVNSAGLDASLTFDITASIRAACLDRSTTVVASLLQASAPYGDACWWCCILDCVVRLRYGSQPTPEVYNLFDDIVLLREGSVIYHGPREALACYLADIGLACPANSDFAGWVVEVITDPSFAFRQLQSRAAAAYNVRCA